MIRERKVAGLDLSLEETNHLRGTDERSLEKLTAPPPWYIAPRCRRGIRAIP